MPIPRPIRYTPQAASIGSDVDREMAMRLSREREIQQAIVICDSREAARKLVWQRWLYQQGKVEL